MTASQPVMIRRRTAASSKGILEVGGDPVFWRVFGSVDIAPLGLCGFGFREGVRCFVGRGQMEMEKPRAREAGELIVEWERAY